MYHMGCRPIWLLKSGLEQGKSTRRKKAIEPAAASLCVLAHGQLIGFRVPFQNAS